MQRFLCLLSLLVVLALPVQSDDYCATFQAGLGSQFVSNPNCGGCANYLLCVSFANAATKCNKISQANALATANSIANGANNADFTQYLSNYFGVSYNSAAANNGLNGANCKALYASTSACTLGSVLAPAPSACNLLPSLLPDVKRTVIFIKKTTVPGEDVFIRGGIDHSRRLCTGNSLLSNCAIPHTVSSLGTSAPYNKYNAWRTVDNYLDWYGNEQFQGSFQGKAASGTPLAWTTSTSSNPAFQPLNSVFGLGDHYWMVDLQMDCSKTENGWFEFKGVLTKEGTSGFTWENDISQNPTCTGNPGGATPYASKNHLARCGFFNIFTWNSGECRIEIH